MSALCIGAPLAVLALIVGLYLRRKLRKRTHRANLNPAVDREGPHDALDNADGLVRRDPDWRNLDSPVDFVRSPGKVGPDDTTIPAFLLRGDIAEICAPDSHRKPLPDDVPIPDFLRRP